MEKEKAKENLWKKLWNFTKRNWLYIVVAEIIFWADLVFIAVFALFYPLYWTLFATVFGIQVTLLPAIPIQLAIATGIKFLWEKIIRKKETNNETETKKHNKEPKSIGL